MSALPDAAVFRPVPPRLAEAFLSEPLPAAGEAPEAVLARFTRDVAPYPFGNGHPRFFGWIDSPPAIMGVFGAANGAAMKPSVACGNHAAVGVERQVAEWFKALQRRQTSDFDTLVDAGASIGAELSAAGAG